VGGSGLFASGASALTVLMEPAGESPALLKLEAMQKVVESDLSDGDKLFLFEFMNTYAPTNELADPREAIMDKLLNVEMTWGDRLRAEGEARGRLAGERTMLLRLLTLMLAKRPPPWLPAFRPLATKRRWRKLPNSLSASKAWMNWPCRRMPKPTSQPRYRELVCHPERAR
jgi:hypothetical protein